MAGSNGRIPAHYHGCIVGVTLALMGLGGAVAIVGGLLFLVVVLRAMRRAPAAAPGLRAAA